MATHSSILTWEIPWIEEPGGLQFMGLQRVGHDLVTKQQSQIAKLLSFRGRQGFIGQITYLVLIGQFLIDWFNIPFLGEQKL